MPETKRQATTRQALLEHGALLFARRPVSAVTAKELHAAIGARNESALHYHFGDKDGLVREIVRQHMAELEQRRAALVASIVADQREGDVRALVHALAEPMADVLGTELGRAHLRLVAQVNHPTLGYGPPFRWTDAPAGRTVSRWLWDALEDLPKPIRTERVAAVRTQLIELMAQRAQLLDEETADPPTTPDELFRANLLDMLSSGLTCPPSAGALAAARRAASGRRSRSAAATNR